MDRERIEAFLARFVGLASGATTIGLLAVADRTGLLSAMAELGAVETAEIAQAADLEHRYVAEILSGLAAAGVVDYDPDTARFHLPGEHALFLADETSPYYMAGFLDMIPLGLSRLDDVAEATLRGGGVAYQDVEEEMGAAVDRANAPSYRTFLTRRWLPAVPGLEQRLRSGTRVADIGCGLGTAARLIAEAFPAASVHGYDISEEAIAEARHRAGDLPNLSFEQMEVADIPIRPSFGLVTAFDVVHDLPDPTEALRRVRQALAEDGIFLMMEPNLSSRLEENLHPRGALFYGISTLYCMTQSLAQGGAGLGAAWGRERAEQLAERAGFASFTHLEEISNRFSAFYLLTP